MVRVNLFSLTQVLASAVVGGVELGTFLTVLAISSMIGLYTEYLALIPVTHANTWAYTS